MTLQGHFYRPVCRGSFTKQTSLSNQAADARVHSLTAFVHILTHGAPHDRLAAYTIGIATHFPSKLTLLYINSTPALINLYHNLCAP